MADGAHVADVHVDVHPDAKGFERELRDQLKAMVLKAKVSPDTKDFKADLREKLKNLGDFKVLVSPDTSGFRTKLAESLKKMTAVPVKVAPDTTGFKTDLKAKLKGLPAVSLKVDNKAALASVSAVGGAIKALPNTVNLDLDTATAAASLAALKAAIQSLSLGSINLDLDTTAATAKITALEAALKAMSAGKVKITVTMPNATSTGQRIGRAAAKQFYKAFKAALATMPAVSPPVGGPGASAAAGTRHGGEFAEGFRNAVRAGIRSLPEPTIGPARNLVDQQIRDIRLALERLDGQTIGVDIDEQAAMRELDRLELELRYIQTQAARGTQVNVDTATAEAALRRFRERMRDFGQDPANAAQQGAASGGAFGNAYTRGVESATRNLRPVQITASTDAVTRDIELIRQRLQSLSTQRVGIDIDAGFALSEVQRLEAELRRLGSLSPNVQVQADTAATAARLAQLQQQLRDLGHTRATAHVDVDVDDDGVGRARNNLISFTSSGRAGINALISAGIAIGPAIVPAAAAAAAAIGAIGPAAFAGAAGIGVGILAFAGVADAVSALGDAQSKAGKTGATYANQQKQIASAQDQVRDAYRGVQEAERNLANAQRDALRAQQDITRAREEAKDALEDLDSSVKNNALSIRQANLDLADAQAELAKVQHLPVNDRQRVEAQLAYDQAKQSLDDLTTRQGRLAEEQQRASKAGVEGSEQVRSAQERAADAQERVRDAAVALTKAQEQVVTAQRNLQTTIQSTSATGGSSVDTLREKMAALSPAGQAFAKFLFGVKDQFKQVKAAAEAGLFPGLQRGIEALLPVLPQIAQFVGRVATAMGNLGEAAGKALASPFWVDFFDYMGKVAAPLLEALGGVFGGLARGFASLLVAFTPFSVQFTQGLAGLAQSFADWAAGLADSKGFNAFIDYVKAEGPKVLKFLGDLVVFIVKLGIALAPLGNLILDGLVAAFDWLAKQDPGVLIGLAAGFAAIALGIMAVVGGPVTAVVAAVTIVAGALVYAYSKFEGFRKVVDAVFTFVKDAVTSFVKAFKEGGDEVSQGGLFGIIERGAKGLRTLFDYVLAGWRSFVDAFKSGGSELQQGGLNAFMANLGTIARQVFEWFRDTGIPIIQDVLTWLGPLFTRSVKTTFIILEALFAVVNWVFTAIVAVIRWAWENVVKPIFAAISWYVENVVGPIFHWLLDNVIRPVWNQIQLSISVAWALIQVVFGVIQIGIKILANVFTWLYDHIIKPVWSGISAAIQAAWNLIRPVFELFGTFIRDNVAPVFSRGVEALKSIWGTLSEAAKVPIRFIVDTVLNNGLIKAYNEIAKMFGVGQVSPINVPGLTTPAPTIGGGGGGGAPKHMATGGFVSGPGTGTSDSIMARLSNGEYVIPARVVAQLGVDFFDWLIGKRRALGRNQKPGDGSEGLAFADGGLVGWITGAMKSTWNTLTDPLGTVKAKIVELFSQIPGANKLSEVGVAATRKLIDAALAHIGLKIQNLSSNGYQGPISADVAAVRDFIRAQAGKPYIWASAGPTGYDCSGIVSAAWNMLHGKNPYNHTFSTHYMADYFTKRNQVGPLTAGWSHAGEREGGSVGHTAGNIAGLPFESRGSRGVIIGNEARPYGNFARWGTFRNGGLVRVPHLFRDDGGRVPPGLSLVDNRTGRDEWMFNDSQMKALVGANAGGDQRRGRGGDVHIDNFNAYANQSPHEIARDLDWFGRHGG